MENGLLLQDKNTGSTDFTRYANFKPLVLKQVQEAMPNVILTIAIMDSAIKFYNEINNLFGFKINLPPIQDSVQNDRLTAEVERLDKTLRVTSATLASVEKELKEKQNEAQIVSAHAQDLVERLHKISKLIPAEISKKHSQ